MTERKAKTTTPHLKVALEQQQPTPHRTRFSSFAHRESPSSESARVIVCLEMGGCGVWKLIGG
jgi:hypothetical protein